MRLLQCYILLGYVLPSNKIYKKEAKKNRQRNSASRCESLAERLVRTVTTAILSE